jgi:DNA-binding Lrp family transcriptional regulator
VSQSPPGRSLELARGIRDVQGVQAADAITGEYDIVVTCESPDINALGTLIVEGIQRFWRASTRRQPAWP